MERRRTNAGAEPVGETTPCLLRDNPGRHRLNHLVQYRTSKNARIDTFDAVSDPTRRGILDRLGRNVASISELADAFDMTLTGMKKHIRILEQAGLVDTTKVGRVRTCRLGKRRLDDMAAWIENYQRMVEDRLDRLAEFLEQTKGEAR